MRHTIVLADDVFVDLREKPANRGFLLKVVEEEPQRIEQSAALLKATAKWSEKGPNKAQSDFLAQTRVISSAQLSDVGSDVHRSELLVVLNRKDFANIFHMMMEFVHIYLSARLHSEQFGLIPRLTNASLPFDVVIFDDLETFSRGQRFNGTEIWHFLETLVGDGGAVFRRRPFDSQWTVEAQKHAPQGIQAKQVIFPHSGYQTPYWRRGRHARDNGAERDALEDCAYGKLMRLFRQYVARRVGRPPFVHPRMRFADRVELRVIFISRRKGATKRIIANENEIQRAIELEFEKRSHEFVGDATKSVHLVVDMVDYSTLSASEQILRTAQADLLVGVHGAGLTNMLFLPPWAGVVQLQSPSNENNWYNCFNLMAKYCINSPCYLAEWPTTR